jgi:hypothetical protein
MEDCSFFLGEPQLLVGDLMGVLHRGRPIERRHHLGLSAAVSRGLGKQRLDLLNDRLAVSHHAASSLPLMSS